MLPHREACKYDIFWLDLTEKNIFELNVMCFSNRNAEKEWVAERDAEIPGQEWEKIAKMCDFNPKATRNVKDTTRMRSILLQLKQANTHLNKS